jgi:peroxiredoxin
MIKKAIIPLILLTAVVLFFVIKPNMGMLSGGGSEKGDSGFSLLTTLNKTPAPDFKLLDVDEKEHTLADYKGKPVIVNFWATWCPPCRKEIPSMNRAWHKIKDEGIAMIAINVGESADEVFAFTAEYPIDFTVLLDEEGKVSTTWPIRGLPTTFILDPEGNLVYQAVGGREWDADEILDQVRALKK